MGMNLLDAAFAVLSKSGQPMSSRDIVQIVMNEGLWTTKGKTPWDTLSANLYTDISKNGVRSRFVKADKKQLFAVNPSYAGTAMSACATAVEMPKERRIWGIHCRIENEELFKRENVIAIGWKEMGDLAGLSPNREAFKDAYAKVHPDAAKQSIATQAGQIYRFACEAQVGDYVLFPSKSDRKIYLGEICGTCFYDADAGDLVQKRKVKWRKSFPRTAFSQGALYEIGSALTFFSVKNYAEEFLSALNKGFGRNENGSQVDIELALTAESVAQQTEDYVLKELSKQLKGYPLENFVASLLEAMGYPHPQISKHGGDRGTDIVAYKDELPPRIVVQVKSQDSDIPERYLSQLRGTLREGDYGVFVCLSDFSENARKYIQENPRIKGVNGHDLVALIFKYYDQLDEKAREIIPLKKVYIPVSREQEKDLFGNMTRESEKE